MKNKLLRLLLTLFLVGIISAAAAWLYIFKKSESNVSSRKVDIEISARELISRFETDENLANRDFLDKVILVSGNIESVSEDSLGISIYLKNSDEIAGVICSFSKGSFDTKYIAAGNPIKVKGLCTGYLMDVVLNKCVIVEK